MSSKISACIALGLVVCTFQIVAVVPGASASGAFVVELPDDFSPSGISGDGKVLAGRGPGGIAARWTAEAGVELLGFAGGAADASRDGSIVAGEWSRPSSEVALWTEGDGVVSLGSGFGRGISSDGTTVIGSVTGIGGSRWTAAEGWISLGHLPDDLRPFSRLEAVSADGKVVVGVAFGFELFSDRAFRWTEATGMVDLGDLGPGFLPSVGATDVSADGSVVVGFADNRDRNLAFRWTEEDGMVSLGFGTARAVSADGSIVAGVGVGGAFLWDAVHGMRHPLVTGWNLVSFEGLSDNGGVAFGLAEDATGHAHFVLTTFPDPDAPECSDAFDNDGDLLGDFPDDPGCTAPDDPTESGECQNGLDDDGDGGIDLADLGCDSAIEASEHSLAFACDDGIDNDGDGLVDLEDPGCPLPFAALENPLCDDGLDNDGDGNTDLADAECSLAWPYWESASPCGLGAELVIALPIVARLRKRVRRR